MKLDTTDMNLTLEVCPPDWAILAALCLVAALLFLLLLVMVWPLDSGLYLESEDPMAQPHGDQPRMPS